MILPINHPAKFFFRQTFFDRESTLMSTNVFPFVEIRDHSRLKCAAKLLLVLPKKIYEKRRAEIFHLRRKDLSNPLRSGAGKRAFCAFRSKICTKRSWQEKPGTRRCFGWRFGWRNIHVALRQGQSKTKPQRKAKRFGQDDLKNKSARKDAKTQR